MNRPMLPTLSEKIPEGNEWSYEIKYDGFRAFLIGSEDNIQLISRNGKNLCVQFPEIVNDLKQQAAPIKNFILDGEIVILNNAYQSNFDLLQTRGRLKNKEKIKEHSSIRPVTFMAFDLLKHEKDITNEAYLARRKKLKKFINSMNASRIKCVESFHDAQTAHKIVFDYLGEGIVAKLNNSLYTYSKRSKEWLKIKLWRTISGFLTEYNPENDYFTAEVYNDEKRIKLGHVKHGLNEEQFQTLRTFFREKGQDWRIDSGVCVDIHCLQAQNGELREPLFKGFRFDLEASDCTVRKLRWSLSLFPEEVEFTNTTKQLWPNELRKEDYLVYLRHVSPYMLPYFFNKKVTVIRYPDGIAQTSFFQKHKPDYAPYYVTGWPEEDGEISLKADQLSPLLWLGNQGALEFHLPFQKALSDVPDEIIFDLDPPSRKEFQSAVLAAQLLKHLLDKLEVHSFVKTSGNKGLQIHIPIEEGEMNYEDTRQFTERLAQLLVNEKPDLFTVERLKKKRGHRLYIDYVQHAEGKTIIAPYSARATNEASVATPLYWKELTESLTPYSFTIMTVINRVQTLGCPFQTYDEVRPLQPIQTMKKL
ncbi:DNA ligase D [Halobacillus sp. B23F22_1]|uniref:DNA ligase D n=1 Tax=Halobacillus sp. B23F22_1 TaxID=3459514 RepID=UPI00373FB7CF